MSVMGTSVGCTLTLLIESCSWSGQLLYVITSNITRTPCNPGQKLGFPSGMALSEIRRRWVKNLMWPQMATVGLPSHFYTLDFARQRKSPFTLFSRIMNQLRGPNFVTSSLSAWILFTDFSSTSSLLSSIARTRTELLVAVSNASER